MVIRVAVLCIFVVGCGLLPKRHEVNETVSPTEALDARADLYCGLEDAAADASGFVGTDCDLVLFNALRSVGCPTSYVDLVAAEDPTRPGEWHRDPARACYVHGDPKASRTSARFSRDMVVGVLLWTWAGGAERLPVLERLIAYVEANDGYVCDAVDAGVRLARCHVGDNLLATMYELRYRLGGADSDKRGALQGFDPLATDYLAHVQALHLYLRGLMFGAVADDELATFDAWASRHPGNALFAAMARKWRSGDLEAITTGALEDVARFPADRLPDSSGRCTPYLWQRVPSSADWQPCDLPAGAAPVVYEGIDLAFLRAVVADLLPVGTGAELALDGVARPHRYRRNGE